MMTLFLSKKLIFALLVSVVAIILNDVSMHGSFKDSKTGLFLRRTGVSHHAEFAWNKFRYYSQQVYRWKQGDLPKYVIHVQDILVPYLIRVKNLLTTVVVWLWTHARLFCQYFYDKKPFINKWVNDNAPGLIDRGWRAWALLSQYTSHVAKLVMELLAQILQWLKDKVFVGQLSPENLQRYTMEALNTTQTLAVKTFSWINSKIITRQSSA